jgi:GMP synthase (glutamine-hydrolysing)
MPSAIAIRHVSFEDLDAFAAPLAARGYAVAYREAPVDDLGARELAEADLLIVLGGPIGAYEEASYPFLKAELRLIEARLTRGRPVLGICLGAQLMAKALGTRVYPGNKELGWAPLDLTADGASSVLRFVTPAMKVLHWHGDTFDLPKGAAHLASTALQFHIEASAKGLERWYVGHTLEIATTPGVELARLRADAAIEAPRLAPAARAALDAFLDGIGSEGR